MKMQGSRIAYENRINIQPIFLTVTYETLRKST